MIDMICQRLSPSQFSLGEFSTSPVIPSKFAGDAEELSHNRVALKSFGICAQIRRHFGE
jgi:hypothetical protein